PCRAASDQRHRPIRRRIQPGWLWAVRMWASELAFSLRPRRFEPLECLELFQAIGRTPNRVPHQLGGVGDVAVVVGAVPDGLTTIGPRTRIEVEGTSSGEGAGLGGGRAVPPELTSLIGEYVALAS